MESALGEGDGVLVAGALGVGVLIVGATGDNVLAASAGAPDGNVESALGELIVGAPGNGVPAAGAGAPEGNVETAFALQPLHVLLLIMFPTVVWSARKHVFLKN